MLNYIWAGLIVSSFLFAVGYDVRDLSQDRYRNGQPLAVELTFPEGNEPGARRVPVQIRIAGDEYGRFYGTDERPAESYTGYLLQTQEGTQLRFDAGASLPEPLKTIATVSKSNDDELQGALEGFTAPSAPVAPPPAAAPASPADSAGAQAAGADVPPPPASTRATVRFEPVRFVKLQAISAAAFDLAATAATIALGLIGVLSLFLGLLKIAEASGVIF